jgi:hypothetical protein
MFNEIILTEFAFIIKLMYELKIVLIKLMVQILMTKFISTKIFLVKKCIINE